MRKIIIALTAGAVMTLAACSSSASTTSAASASTASTASSATSVTTTTPAGIPSGGEAFSTPLAIATAIGCDAPMGSPYVAGAMATEKCYIGGQLNGDEVIISTFKSDGPEDNVLYEAEKTGAWADDSQCVLLGPGWAINGVTSPNRLACNVARQAIGGTEYPSN